MMPYCQPSRNNCGSRYSLYCRTSGWDLLWQLMAPWSQDRAWTLDGNGKIRTPFQLIFRIKNTKQTSKTQAQCYSPAIHWPLALKPTEFLLEESDAQSRARRRGQDFQGRVA